jgi:hypothetical protein
MQMRRLDLRHRVALAEAKLADLKIALGGHAGAARRMAGNGAGSHTTGAVWDEPVAMASVNRMTR